MSDSSFSNDPKYRDVARAKDTERQETSALCPHCHHRHLGYRWCEHADPYDPSHVCMCPT